MASKINPDLAGVFAVKISTARLKISTICYIETYKAGLPIQRQMNSRLAIRVQQTSAFFHERWRS